MGKFWVVFKREYLERVRSKWFIIATLFGPLFFAAITIVPMIMAARTKQSADLSNIVVLDATGAGLGNRVANALGGGLQGEPSQAQVREVTTAELAAAESLATQETISKTVRGYLVVDSATMAGTAARYAGRNASSLVDVSRIERAVRQGVMTQRLEAEGLDANRVAALTTFRLNLKAERITDTGRGGSAMANTIFGYVVAFLLYLMIAIYGQYILRGVMEEKMTRVAEVVVSSVPTDTLLAGKVLGVGAVAMTQQIAWALSALALVYLRQPILAKFGAAQVPFALPSISLTAGIALLLFFILGFIFYASLFAAVGAMVNSDQDAQQAAMPVTILLIASIVFIQPILMNPQSRLATVMSLLPFSAPILMPLRMTLTSVPWYELVGSIVGVALACVAAIWLAARIYRVGLLMYGKRPSVRELVRWVRYSG